nr:hypothetical protein [Sulfobacillus thermotolerans]
MVLRVHFYHATGQQTQSLASAAHHIAYMGSVEKHELLVDAEDRTTLASAAIHARYAGERDGSLGYFGTVDAATAASHIQQARGTVWRVILSVGEADALAMGGGLTTKAGWSAAAQKAVPTMIRRLGLDLGHVEWIAAVHRHQKHEHNPHIHLLFWESGTPTRKTMKWSAQELRDVRRAWAKELYAPELAVLGEDKTTARQTAVEMVNHLLDQAQGTARGSSWEQGFLQELLVRLGQLGTQLPGHGRLAYAYMPPATKQAVQEVARWMITQDATLQAAFHRYVAQAVQFGMVHWASPGTTDWGGRDHAIKRAATEQTIRERAERDLLQRLAAPILRAAYQTAHSGAPDAASSKPQHTTYGPTASVGALVRDLQWALKKAAWEGRQAAYQQAEAAWKRQAVERQIARNMGLDIQL